MKIKITALLISISIAISGFAQFKPVPSAKFQRVSQLELKKGNTKNSIKLPNQSKGKNDGKELFRDEIGTSANALSVLRPERKPLKYLNQWYHQYENDILSFTFNGDPASYQQITSDGQLIHAISEREEFSEFFFWEFQFPNPNGHFLLYPSAALLNPLESNNLNDSYFVTTTVDTVSTSQNYSILQSYQFNNQNFHEYQYEWTNENDQITSGICLTGNKAHMSGVSYISQGSYGINQTLKSYLGTYENPEDGYNWTINEVTPNWMLNANEGYAYALYNTWSAWSNDGTKGYMWMIGVTEESYEHGVYQPQVYYTTNSGETWAYIDLNFENNEVLVDYLPAWLDENGNPGTVRPSFLNAGQQFPGEVDKWGNLHLFAAVYGSTTGSVSNPDEGNWVDESAPGGHIFSFRINQGGLQEVYPVAEIKTRPSTHFFGSLGLDHRLQSAKSDDEYIILCTWIDDVISGADSLVFPDIFGWNNCAGWGLVEPINLTIGTLYEGFYFYPFLADKIYYPHDMWGVGVFLSTSVSPSEFMENDPTAPVTHFLVQQTEMEFDTRCLEGIEEHVSEDDALEVSQNNPNPFTNETILKVSNNAPNPEKMTIEIFSAQGIGVYKEDFGYLIDEKEITISADSFLPGVYFYTVTVGNSSKTLKMVVM
jgi:hypothetical protein